MSELIVPGDLFARHQTITGLRALADFMEANLAVPIDEYGEIYTHFTRHPDDAHAVAEVDRVAGLLDVPIEDRRDQGGHYTAARRFGRITYRIVHIPERAMADHEARTSYGPNIRLHNQNDQAA